MRFAFNPFTDKLDITGIGPGVTSVDFLTGNSGGQVAADAGFNIFVLGDNASGIDTIGNLSPNTLTIFGLASSTTQVGTTRYASNAEAAAQTIGTAALTPSNITSLFSTSPLPSAQGGTGLSSPAAHQLIVTNGSSAYTPLGVASNGQIPIGSIGSNPVLAAITQGTGITVTNGPGTITIASTVTGGITAISGDSGTTSASTISLLATATVGSSVNFAASASQIVLNVTDANNNTFYGLGSGSATAINGSANSGFGNLALESLNGTAGSGSNNTACGYAALALCTTGNNNTAVGETALVGMVAGNENTAIGTASMASVTSGLNNTAVGNNTLNSATACSYNLVLGDNAGNSLLNNNNSNILIANAGVAADVNTLRIGTHGSGNAQVSKCFVAGINGNTLVSPNFVTIDTSTGQLGTVASSGVVETITGDSGGALSPTTGNFNILGRSGNKTSGSGSTLTVKSPPYADASSTTTSVLNTGEFVTGAFTRTLPASAGLADGDLFEYVCTSASQLTIQAVGAQQIRIGSAISSAAGTAKSNAIGDSISLRFRAADGFFYATSVVGTWTTA